MRSRTTVGGGLAALALGLSLAAVPTPAQAAIACDVGALQTAITAANVNGGTIDLAPNCTYSVTDPQAIGPNAMPVITNDITLNGFNSIIERSGTAVTLFRIFEVGGTSGKLTLNRVTVRGGHSASNGGGILVNSGRTLTLNAATVVKENESDQNGGGVFSAGHVFLNPGSRVDDNRAAISGGGIHSLGDATAQSANVSANRALTLDGGGVFNGTGATLDLRTTTISGNHAFDDAGGVFNDGTVTAYGSVIAGNTSLDQGGGVDNNSGTFTFTSGRISDNSTNFRGGGVHNSATLNLITTVLRANHVTVPALTSHGGGLYNAAGTATLTSSNVYSNTVAPPGNGGGIFEQPGSTVNLVTSTVFSNSPDNCQPPGQVPGCSG
ncbi:hypothetical protein JBE04_30085 [Streptomyces sp. PRKS01-29]|nr:hypothetical protein [Streptomyces sabulosicollis]MBI0298599.1 hypothetical protein [Streptomyces sabulosicollis]